MEGLPAGLDRHIDATRSIAVRLRLRDTLQKADLHEMLDILVDSCRRALDPLGQFLDSWRVMFEDTAIELGKPVVPNHVGDGQHRIKGM